MAATRAAAIRVVVAVASAVAAVARVAAGKDEKMIDAGNGPRDMEKPKAKGFWGVAAKGSTSRLLHKRLAFSTILAVSPFLGYGRSAYAACVLTGASTYSCSGEIPGDVIDAPNANVSTLPTPPFVVTDDGLVVSGLGDIRFTDNNASSITKTGYGAGLSVKSFGDILDGADGAVTIITNGTITGRKGDGIYAYNDGSGDLSITVDGDVTGMDSGEVSVASDGIYAVNYGNDLTITTRAQSTVTGNENAIDARNYGDGNLDITVYGKASSYEEDGIFARNGDPGESEAVDLNIIVGAQAVVDGAKLGIQAQNYGRGELSITIDGSVTGRGYDGIYAINEGTNLIITTGASSVIRGNALPPEDPQAPVDSNGIDARNYGSGYLKIAADGVVFGNLNDGIFALNYGTDLTIETGASSVVKGGGNGIGAYNYGNGDLKITANGIVGGYSDAGSGIKATNYGYLNDDDTPAESKLTITTGAASVVTGKKYGIDARNFGFGDLAITTNGAITGQTGSGIKAINSFGLYVDEVTQEERQSFGGNLTITTNAAVTGKASGIDARNFGKGDLTIKAYGQVTGEARDGIFAIDGGKQNNGNNISVLTGAGSIVTGGEDGIDARNFGGGNLTITTGPGGVVTGDHSGIYSVQFGAGELKVTINGAVTGKAEYGLNARSMATTIEIGANGLVQGRVSGLMAVSSGGQPIKITNAGTVRNLSLRAGDLAIRTVGAAAQIGNTGAIVGTLTLTDFSDKLENDGLWITTGENSFGGGDDTMTNRGTLFAADDPAIQEAPVLLDLENFSNEGGLISLVDGQAGDELRINTLEYKSANGRLAVDAVLGPSVAAPGKLADDLWIDGNATGTTTIAVNVVDATGANSDGIVVARVRGTAEEDSFVLAGPVNGGFFTWGLRYESLGPIEQVYKLYTTGTGVGAYEFAGGITGAQDLWFQTAGTLLQRQMDLRSLLGGTAVTPVADFAEPVAPTPVAKVTPGFWFSGLGAWLERDGEQDGFTLDRKQTIWGGMAGFDFGTQDAGDAMLFGVFGGYLTSELDFKETGTEWTYEGPTFGAYATWLDRAFYVDATVKVDFLDITIDPDEMAPEADESGTDALNIGGRIDTGYRFGESLFVEPQASLAVIRSEIDDVDVFGGTVAFDDGTSVRGRLGLRLGFDQQAEDAMIYSGDVIASVWESFSGDNKATIATPGLPDFGVSDDPGATLGDVSLGFAVASPEGWSGFLRGNYQFADGYDAYSGNVGVRYSW